VSDVHDEYVSGDINSIDEAEYDDEYNDAPEAGNSDNAARATTAVAVLEFVAKSLADDPEAVSVDVNDAGSKVVLSLNVGAGDMGRVIGRRGRTAQALRTLVGAAGARDGVTTSVDIVD
jgi:hypothetical protein